MKNDVLVEAFIVEIRAGFRRVLGILARGRTRQTWYRHLDVESLDPALLPYDDEVLAYLAEERRRGRALALVTDLGQKPAERIAEHLGIFDDVVAGGGGGDTAGTARAARLAERFGPGGFDFLGGHPRDHEALVAARRSILVRPSGRLSRIAAERDNFEVLIPARGVDPKVILEAMRPHQWLKNLLVFVPPFAGQALTNWPVFLAAAMAFLTFSLTASAIYLVNDLVDVRSDRQDATKRERPFASGRLPITIAPYLVIPLLIISFGLSWVTLPGPFVGVLAAYLVLTSAYSLRLKGAVLIDVFMLAGLYTLRVIAGGAATAIAPSVWLLVFSMFLFLSLALVKRYAELFALPADSAGGAPPGRNYRKGDLPVLIALGCASGYLAALVLALYIVTDEAAAHYRDSNLIWLLCPLLLYWISRAWIAVSRSEMHEDPLVWALEDQISRWVAIAAATVLLLAA